MYDKAPYFYGTGRRKSSVARVRVYKGTGKITINDRDIDDYFGLETLKLIVLVQKKIKRGDSISKIADDLVEDEITITPIYKIVKEFPEDTERDIYWKLNDSMQG